MVWVVADGLRPPARLWVFPTHISPGGLVDKARRQHPSAPLTPEERRRMVSCARTGPAPGPAAVLALRHKRRWGADRIAYEVGLASSKVQHILRGARLGRLDRGDRATDRSPVRRYQRDRPGELIHVDINKIAAIPTGGWSGVCSRGCGSGFGGDCGAALARARPRARAARTRSPKVTRSATAAAPRRCPADGVHRPGSRFGTSSGR